MARNKATRNRAPAGYVTLSSNHMGGAVIAVPTHIVQRIPHLLGTYFKCELVDEGILYRPIDTLLDETPDWAKKRR